MIDRNQIRALVEGVLRGLDLYSPAAVNLLLGTAAQESRLGTYLRQVGGGPALGIYQMEPATEHDLWGNYIRYRPDLASRISMVCGRSGPGPWLEWDLAYQTAMARVHYLRIPVPLPDPDDIPGLARYYKMHYNTPAGAATEAEFVANYHRYVMEV